MRMPVRTTGDESHAALIAAPGRAKQDGKERETRPQILYLHGRVPGVPTYSFPLRFFSKTHA